MVKRSMGIQAQVMAFAVIAFTLLGVLFGMNIMSFIFGNLGPAQSGIAAGSDAFNVSLNIQNQSLQAISTYANQSTTQFSTLSIAITLIILLSVFAVFWFFFMGGGGKGSGVAGGGGGNFG